MRKWVAEFIGTAFLLCTVVGSGIMGQNLSEGNLGLALWANSLATGAALVVLILIFAPISGAHFNPVVTLCALITKKINSKAATGYVVAQVLGAFAGVMVAHLMFGYPALMISQHVRTGSSQGLSEVVATFGLLAVIQGCKHHTTPIVASAVGAYIMAAYWFTSSTSFANPAVTLARAFTDTFAGIHPSGVLAFVVAQTLGALAATFVFKWFDQEVVQ